MVTHEAKDECKYSHNAEFIYRDVIKRVARAAYIGSSLWAFRTRLASLAQVWFKQVFGEKAAANIISKIRVKDFHTGSTLTYK